MKTKELIKRLQEEDPSGELDVSVGNCDIHFVDCLPGYYDGCQQVLIRDENNKYYNIIGGKYNATKEKVMIHTLAFTDAIWEDHKLPIDYSDLDSERTARYKENDDKIRQEAADCDYRHELEYFTKHIKERAAEISGELNGIEDVAKDFFDKNLSPEDSFPKDISWKGESYVSQRNKQWLREIEIIGGTGWEIVKKPLL
jgi:hypothetical protein